MVSLCKLWWWWWCVAGCGWVVSGDAVPGELYSSLALTKHLFVLDHSLGQLLTRLPHHTPCTERYLESYLWAVEDTPEGQHHLELTGNPLHVYALIKRLVRCGPEVLGHLAYLHNRTLEDMTHLVAGDTSMVLPSERDLQGAGGGLGRLQWVYRLPISHLLHGRILDNNCSVRLDVYDCQLIANQCRLQEQLSTAWEWYRAALTLATEGETIYRIKHDMFTLAKQVYEVEYPQQSFQEPLSVDPEPPGRTTDFHKLCRGEASVTEEQQRGMQCHVSARGSSYLVLQPVRYEQLLHHPELYLFYDVVTPAQITVIQQLSEQTLHRSGVLNQHGPSETRVSHVSWLENYTHPVLESVGRRISYMTGLHVHEGVGPNMAGEQLQVQNYGIGGYFIYHHDALYKTNPEAEWAERQTPGGDRLASFMIYMSEVEAGGRTVFPMLGALVTPVKGAAVLWYNLHRNGYLDRMTLHGGCPVLLGNKWVANKWIHEGANYLRRRCSLDPDA